MTTLDQIRETVFGPREVGGIITPEALTLSDDGTSTRIRSEIGIRLLFAAIPAVMAAMLMASVLEWVAPIMPQIFDNSLVAGSFTITMIVLATAAAAKSSWVFVTDLLHGHKGPGKLWVIEELHAPVESAIHHLRQMPATRARNRLVSRLERTLKLTRSAVIESLDDPSVIIHVVRWSTEHIEWITERAQYLTTHPNSGFTAQ
ncbi:hypothetical protein [Corynebacterium kalidii]